MDRFFVTGDKVYQKLGSMLDDKNNIYMFNDTSIKNLMYRNVNVIWDINKVPKKLTQLIPFKKNGTVMIYHGENASELPICITSLGTWYESYKFKNGVEIFVAYL
ncbi:unnamed protein product [marine sediment metagenome]|uniref:Uncharacterized protein n=1 Tax=marine sediment metagenome TaxID=412755 RepID=X1AKH2_9ZZZZ